METNFIVIPRKVPKKQTLNLSIAIPAILIGALLSSHALAQSGVPSTPTSAIINDDVMRATLVEHSLLFDGRTLNGWSADSAADPSVAGGALILGSNTHTASEDSYLSTTKNYLNFELLIKARALNGNKGGIEFLSTSFVDSKGASRTVKYQFDVGESGWGGLYDGGTRNRMVRVAPVSPLKNASVNPEVESYNAWVDAVVNPTDFNQLRLVVEYPRIRGYVNGVIAFDFTETDFEILDAVKTAIANGQGQPIRLELEAGSSARVDYRGITLQELDNSEIIPLGNANFAEIGRWLPPVEMGLIGINTHLLPTGKVLIHDSTEEVNYDSYWIDNPNIGTDTPSLAAIYDPLTKTFENLDDWFLTEQEIELFCSGHTFLPNGELVYHGNSQWAGNGVRPNLTSQATWNASITYDYASGVWKREEDSKRAAYYPTVAGLLSGDALTFAAGTETKGKTRLLGDHTEVFNYQTRQWRMLEADEEWSDLTSYIGKNSSLVSLFDTYYNIAMMPGTGKILHLGGPSHLIAADFAGDGGAEYYTKGDDIVRWYGQHQIFGNGKILHFAGGSYDVRYGSTNGAWDGAQALPNSATIIDMNGDVPTAVRTGDMQEGRQRATSTLLADGTVMSVGGYDGLTGEKYHDSAIRNVAWSSVKLRPEIWDPATGIWSEMHPAQRRRQYHSTAMLMPDGRVMVAGSGYPRQWQWFIATDLHGVDAKGAYDQYQPWDDYSMEIFEPPYLFDEDGNYATRPDYLWTPPSIGYQNDFGVVLDSTAPIKKAHLIKLSSQTHGVEMSARLVELNFTQSNRVLSVDGLEDSTIAPPGHYMLIVVNNDGVPSEGKIIKVDGHLSVQLVSSLTGKALSKNSDTFIDNESIGTADFNHSEVSQSWQLNHGKWTGDGYRFVSRQDLTALSFDNLSSFQGHPVLESDKIAIDEQTLGEQTFTLAAAIDGKYVISNQDLAVDNYWQEAHLGSSRGIDEIVSFPYDGRENQHWYIYPTSAPTTIRSLVTGGGINTNVLVNGVGGLGDLTEDAHGFLIQPSSSGEGTVKIAYGADRGLGYHSSNVLESLSLTSGHAATNWIIEYLPKGLSRLKHVETGLYLSSVPHTGPYVRAGLSSNLGRMTMSAYDEDDAYQLWRLTN